MAGNKLTIALTPEQQAQIRAATGTSITELKISLPATGSLSEKELGKVTGGASEFYMTIEGTKQGKF